MQILKKSRFSINEPFFYNKPNKKFIEFIVFHSNTFHKMSYYVNNLKLDKICPKQFDFYNFRD